MIKAGKASRRPEYFGESFLEYKNLFLSDRLGGRVVDISAIVGFLVTVLISLSKKVRQNYIGLLWLGSIVLTVLLLTGLSTHAEARFVCISLVLL